MKVVLCVLGVAIAMFLQGCTGNLDSCDESATDQCGKANLAGMKSGACPESQKFYDCYKECCTIEMKKLNPGEEMVECSGGQYDVCRMPAKTFLNAQWEETKKVCPDVTNPCA